MADLLHSQCDEMLVYHIATPVNKWIPPCDVVNKVMMGAIRAPLVFWLPFVPQWFHKNNIHVLIFVDSFPDRRMPKNVAFSVCSHFYVILLSWPHSVRCVSRNCGLNLDWLNINCNTPSRRPAPCQVTAHGNCNHGVMWNSNSIRL